jgi:hypothetical protein
MRLYCARLPTNTAFGRNRGGRASISAYAFATVNAAVPAATVPVAPVRTPCGFTPVPPPVAKAVASSTSLASWIRRAISDSSEPQSWLTSIENGMNACAFVTVAAGCTRVGASSETSSNSRSRDATTAPALTPFQVLPVIDSTRLIARHGFTAPFDVGMIVGSRVTGTA